MIELPNDISDCDYSIPHAMLIIIQQVDVAQMHWLELKIVPIAKADEMSSPANYRPISILPIVSKVLERHISNIIMDHLEEVAPISANLWVSCLDALPQLCFQLPIVVCKPWTWGMMYVPYSLISVRETEDWFN